MANSEEPKKESGTNKISALPVKMRVMAYSRDAYVEKEIASPAEINDYLGKWTVVWLEIEGINRSEILQDLVRIFDLHPLAIEDVEHKDERAKVEEYGKTQFVIAKTVCLKEHLIIDQLSIFLGESFVLTFQGDNSASCDDNFLEVKNRIRKGRGRIRELGTDYLLYALVDAVVDSYFPILELYGDRLEDLEDEILSSPQRKAVARVHRIKRDLHLLRRAVWPLRDAVSLLARDPIPMIQPETRIYLRDCYDHCIRIMDLLETDRELCSDLMEVYLSSVSNRLNEVMKVLTIFMTIFLPPSLVAAIYGMNFRTDVSPWNMPELNWYYGYEFALSLMLGLFVLGISLWFAWEKGWIGSKSGRIGRREKSVEKNPEK